MRKFLRVTLYIFLSLALLLGCFIVCVGWGLESRIPDIRDRSAERWQRQTTGNNSYQVGNNWLRQDESGLWEEYLEAMDLTGV